MSVRRLPLECWMDDKSGWPKIYGGSRVSRDGYYCDGRAVWYEYNGYVYYLPSNINKKNIIAKFQNKWHGTRYKLPCSKFETVMNFLEKVRINYLTFD